MIVRKCKAWEIYQGISQRNKRYVSAEKIKNCLLKWVFFSHSEYGVNVDLLSCRTSYHLSCYQREPRALSYDKCKSLLFQWNTERGRGVLMYTTQVNSAFRARWLASSVIIQVLFLAFKWRNKNPYSKIARTFKVLSPSSKRSLKNKLLSKFSTWYRFPFWKYSYIC